MPRKAPAPKLPAFIAPMLAKTSEPFDSEEHLFEVKWDGTRALAFIEKDGYRLVNRRRFEIAPRYPELDPLHGLEPGTVLDGEVVVLRNGKPDFSLLLSREHAGGALRRRGSALHHPATYIVFDQLYARHESLCREPLHARRDRLRETLAPAASPRLVVSEGVTGAGRRFFEEVCGRGLEGVMAKRLDSAYLAGKRSDAWLKIKRAHTLLCAIIGFVPAGASDLRSLIIAAEEKGELRPVGKVGSGLTAEARADLNRRLRARLRAAPLVPCALKGMWVEPGLYCRVTYLEKSSSGQLRAPVFEELIVE
jgi:DNA ligase D-like protein (predicted ligase)